MKGRLWLAIGLLLAAVSVTSAQQSTEAGEDEPPPAELPTIKEDVVVSASATGLSALDSPAAVDVITGQELQERPAEGWIDHLRRVPGVNVVQFSARDVNISSRGSTGGINTSTLPLVDGRTIYLDFLNFTMWEFAPADPELIDRVEVVRGPASSIWGANAVGGVVQVLTKSPRDTPGGRLLVEAGSYDAARVDFRQSFMLGPWALRLTGGYFRSDALDRPTSNINWLGEPTNLNLGLPPDSLEGRGTEQPRVDLRADWTDGAGSEWILEGGSARTDGWITTGLGPFDINRDTGMSYLQGRFRRGPFEVRAHTNFFDGDAVNLINGLPFVFRSATTQVSAHGRSLIRNTAVFGWGGELERSAFDLSLAPAGSGRTKVGIFGEIDLPVTERFWMTGGGRFDYFRETIGLAFSPRAALRFKVTPQQTWRVAAGRSYRAPSVIETDLDVSAVPVAFLDWEAIDTQIGLPIFAPLSAFICGMQPDNCGAPPGQTPDYTATIAARGSRGLREEVTNSVELGWVAELGGYSLSATLWRTRSEEGLDFAEQARYGVGPDGTPGTADDIVFAPDPTGDGIVELPAVDVCPYVDALPPFNTLCPSGPVTYPEFVSILLDDRVPAAYQYRNGAGEENFGFELGTGWRGPAGLSAWFNYSWQETPRVNGTKMTDRIAVAQAEYQANSDLDSDGVVFNTADFVNIPARSRVSLGATIDRGAWFVSGSLDYVDETFWQDVATPDFWDFVGSHTLVGVRGGLRFPDPGLELTLGVTNLLDDRTQLHPYGDIIDRRIRLGVGWNWGARAAQP